MATKGLGNYVHLMYQDYLNYSIYQNYTNPDQGKTIRDLTEASEEIKQRISVFANKSNNKAEELELYLTGIFYPDKFNSNNNNNRTYETEMSEDVKKVFKLVFDTYGTNPEIGYEAFYNDVIRKVTREFKSADIIAEGVQKKVKELSQIISTLSSFIFTISKTSSLNEAERQAKIKQLENYIDSIKKILNPITNNGKTSLKDLTKKQKEALIEIKDKDLIDALEKAIAFINAEKDTALLDTDLAGNIGEQAIAAILLCRDAGIENIEEKIRSSVVGANGTPTTLKLSDIVSGKILVEGTEIARNSGKMYKTKGLNSRRKDAEKFWYYDGETKQVSSKESQDTVDISVDLSPNNPLKDLLNTDQINASIKNYKTDNNITVLGGAPLLSILQMGNTDFANHYLNFVGGLRKSSDPPDPFNFENFNGVLRAMIAARSFLGIRDLEQGNGGVVKINEYFILNNKSKKRVDVLYAPQLVKELLETAASWFKLEGLPISHTYKHITKRAKKEITRRNFSEWKFGIRKDSSGNEKAGRIESLLAEVNAKKITAHFNMASYKGF